MSTLINTLKGRISYLERENETLASAVDNVSQAYATTLEKLRPHDPDYVAKALGQVPDEDHSDTGKGS
jgi:hypothetical protein